MLLKLDSNNKIFRYFIYVEQVNIFELELI